MRFRWVFGASLLLAGAAMLLSVFFWPPQNRWQIERFPLPIPKGLMSHYPATAFERWQLHQPESGGQLTEQVIFYRQADGHLRQALLPVPGSSQWQNWVELGRVLQSVEDNALVLAWWDDSQRVDFFSGRETWITQPPASAFAKRTRDLWRQLSGGFHSDAEPLSTLARWWMSTPARALADIRQQHIKRPIYWLATGQSLLHSNEIERLAGSTVPLEVRIFPDTGNLHGQIAAVQRWAQETGHGYMPQKVPGSIAAWRITRKTGLPFWLQLLPFSSSPKNPPANLERVFSSADRNLILYRVKLPQNLP